MKSPVSSSSDQTGDRKRKISASAEQHSRGEKSKSRGEKNTKKPRVSISTRERNLANEAVSGHHKNEAAVTTHDKNEAAISTRDKNEAGSSRRLQSQVQVAKPKKNNSPSRSPKPSMIVYCCPKYSGSNLSNFFRHLISGECDDVSKQCLLYIYNIYQRLFLFTGCRSQVPRDNSTSTGRKTGDFSRSQEITRGTEGNEGCQESRI